MVRLPALVSRKKGVSQRQLWRDTALVLRYDPGASAAENRLAARWAAVGAAEVRAARPERGAMAAGAAGAAGLAGQA